MQLRTGRNALQSIRKNKFLKKDFPGRQHKHATKIIYELCKSVGLNYAQLQREKLIPEIAEEVIKKLPSTASRVRLSTHSKLYTKIYFWMVGNPSRDFFDRSTICENIANGLTNGCDEGYGCAFGSNGRKLVADIRI